MKFRAVVITRKKLIMIIAASAATAALGIAEAASGITVPFNGALCRNMISSTIGGAEYEKPDFREIINNFLGFDLSRPETILDGYAPNGTDGEEADDKDEDSADKYTSAKEEGADIYEETGYGEPPLPSREQISAASGLPLNNATNYDVDPDALCAQELKFKLDGDGPQVLIVHTHTTECYNGDQMPGETERTTDAEKSVVAVGRVIAETLEENGISVYHDETFHDYPSYQGSYTRSLATVTRLMEEYPSIKVVLDVHRDAFVYADGTRLRVVDENADVPTSQVMLVSGTDSMGLYDPDWRENLKFAAKIQNAAEIMYPGLMRSIDLRTERFNLHMTTGSLILEVGSNGNTLEEAKNAGHDVARAIAAVLEN